MMGDVMRSVGDGEDTARAWRGMEMFVDRMVGVDDERLDRVYDHYRSNLNDICRIGVGAGGRVVLCTVAVNLTDSAPFASIHREDLDAQQLARWQQLYQEAAELEAEARWTEAIERFQAALEIDDQFADLHFRLARCFRAVDDHRRARDHYRRARDLDALRFGADSRINDVVREVAGKRADERVHLVDVERIFETGSSKPHGTVGGDLFHEHVHMNFDGHYALAAAVFEQIAAIVPESARRGASEQASAPTKEQCAAALALAARGRLANARAHYDEALRINPMYAEAYNNLGLLLQSQDDPAGAIDQYRQALRCKSNFAAAHYNIAIVLQRQDQVDEAVSHYGKALEIDPDASRVHNNLGNLLQKHGRFDEAIQHYRQALRVRPDYALAHHNLGCALRSEGQLDEAIRHFEIALQLKPDYAAASRNLAKTVQMKAQRQGQTPTAP